MRYPEGEYRIVITIWVLFVLSCAWLTGRANYTADLSAFLPSAPTQEQRLLVDLLRDGMVSRLILVGIEGADSETRAFLSKGIAGELRNNPAFSYINNGEVSSQQKDREFIFNNRYLLSPKVDSQLFSVAGLHSSVSKSLEGLSSSAGLFLKTLLPRDPTGEMNVLLAGFNSQHIPPTLHGAWASRDSQRALLLFWTRVPVSDIDGQQQAITTIQQAFENVLSKGKADGIIKGNRPRLLITGPGVFSVKARDTIRNEATRLSIISSVMIVALLLVIYRSLTVLMLGLLPVLSGALAGIAAVSLGFGMVHGITLGFGTTLIGESVDYSIYRFLQSGRGENWVEKFWPTVRLGVFTSVSGFASLAFSGFPGLAQLGLYSIVGLLTAATVTRFVLPAKGSFEFAIRDLSPVGRRLQRLYQPAHYLIWPLALLLLLSCALIYRHADTLWNRDISALSPVSPGDQVLDAGLRADIGAPDVRYLAVVKAMDAESALVAAEKLGARLHTLVDKGVLAGFETPARFLPSRATQMIRLESLPTRDILEERLQQALKQLPVQAERFSPFVSDIEAVRNRGPLQRSDLDGTSFGLSLDGLLVRQGAEWLALLPLMAPSEGPFANSIDATRIRAELADDHDLSGALIVDIKKEADQLYGSYLREAIFLSALGLLIIVIVLLAALRSLTRVARVLAPLLLAVIVVIGGFIMAGHQLTMLHLIGLLLIVAVGSNYSLFFDKQSMQGDQAMLSRTLASLLFANMTTVTGFGLLAFSKVPVLQSIGITVGPGAILALVFSAILAQHRPA